MCICVCGLVAVGVPAGSAVARLSPGGRVYEMVSPVDKNGGQIDGGATLATTTPQQASEDGETITFGSQVAFAGAEGGLATVQYLARRDPGLGWLTESITPRQDPPVAAHPVLPGSDILQGSDANSLYQDFTPDLAHGFMVAGDPAPVPGAPVGYFNPYTREGDGSYRLLSSAIPPVVPPGPAALCCEPGLDIGFAGASADGSHVIFEATDALTPDAVPGHVNLYESFDGGLRLVSVLPGGSPDPGEVGLLAFGANGNGEGKPDEAPFGVNFDRAISSDGSRIFWSGSDRQLYLRENGETTVQVSASQKTNGSGPGGGDPSGSQPAYYRAATSNGSSVLFTSSEQLTNDSTALAPNDEDLYRYDVGTQKLVDLTVDHSGETGGARVAGVLGTSEDGSYVYFAAGGVLAEGAVSSEVDGRENIYVWHEGTISLVTRMSQEPGNIPWKNFLRTRTSRVSPNGRFLAFESAERLTSYDNRGFKEVYEYDATTGMLACASCNPSGPPVGDSLVPQIIGLFGGPGWGTLIRQQRYLLDDGRLFFNSRDALVPRDTNASVDVYEYRQGRIDLVSSGTGEQAEAFPEPEGAPGTVETFTLPESEFLDAGANGRDVFFLTRDKLAFQDVDSVLDLYDARIGGGFPRLSPVACTGTGCQGVPPPAPIFMTPASVTFSGSGNPTAVKPATKKKPAGKRHHKKKRVRRRHVAHKRG